ncbi:MAG: ABC transporter ATP-binding protein [Burkholderiaceae bacterium]|nr:ABC transporter ATP-binding protein [Burkholderiaceae bacterium]
MRTAYSTAFRTNHPGAPAAGAPPVPLVRFQNVQKSYDGATLVVKNLNLEIRKHEFLTMLGPSGSGKTTCLMMLAGFETATAGEILLDGRPINRIPPERRNIGMVFQNYALFPHMTVRENLEFPLRVRRLPKADIDQKVQRALGMVNLAGYASRMPGQLSGGQQQRVAVARALVFEPALVLMDEPLGALDKQLREQMQYEIKRLHLELGLTIVYVTHDQDEALTMSDRIAVFDDGVIQQLAGATQLYEQPDNAFVARFIGENNEIPGRVVAIDGQMCDVEVAGPRILGALNVVGGSIGDSVTLSLRPERIQLRPAPDGGFSCIDARVRELIYHGDHIRVIAEIPGSVELIVKIPNGGAVGSIEVGQTLSLGWRPGDCRALN